MTCEDNVWWLLLLSLERLASVAAGVKCVPRCRVASFASVLHRASLLGMFLRRSAMVCTAIAPGGTICSAAEQRSVASSANASCGREVGAAR